MCTKKTITRTNVSLSSSPSSNIKYIHRYSYNNKKNKTCNRYYNIFKYIQIIVIFIMISNNNYFIQSTNAIHVKLSLTNVMKIFQHYDEQSKLLRKQKQKKQQQPNFMEIHSQTKVHNTLNIPTREGITTDVGHTLMEPIPVPQLPGKPMPCFGLPSVACKNTQDMAEAGNAKDECKKMFCHPLCLKDVWKCDIEGGTGAFGVVGSPPVHRALCNEFIAYGCSVLFKCCDHKDPMLHRYIQPSYVGQDSLPNAVIKIPPCAHDPAIPQQADLVCTACKGDVTVSFDLKDDRCTDLKANKPLEKKWGEEELFHSEHDQFQVDHMLEPFLLKPLGVAGTHRSLYERCKLLQKEVAGQLALMVEKANARICTCLGCCPTAPHGKFDCFFPEMFDS